MTSSNSIKVNPWSGQPPPLASATRQSCGRHAPCFCSLRHQCFIHHLNHSCPLLGTVRLRAHLRAFDCAARRAGGYCGRDQNCRGIHDAQRVDSPPRRDAGGAAGHELGPEALDLARYDCAFSGWRTAWPNPRASPCHLAPQGRVLARHLKSASISQLDGYTVYHIPAPDTGNGRIYESPGGQLWTVVAEGLQEFRNGNWVLHPVPEIAAEFRARLPRLIDPAAVVPGPAGRRAFPSAGPLARIQCRGSRPPPRSTVLLTAAQTRLEKFSGMTLARDGGLWIAGARGLVKVSGPVRKS